MPEWDEDEENNILSLEDIEKMENSHEHEDDPCYDEDDWGESYDDLDSEAWERQYHLDEDSGAEPDPWDLD